MEPASSGEYVFCNDRIKFRRLRSQNIVHRLRNREAGFRHRTSQHAVRELYQNIYPNLTIVKVERPPCYLRKFSPDGKYLIAFSSDQAALEIYEYQGCSAAGELLSTCGESKMLVECLNVNGIRANIFDKLFKLKHVVNLENHEKHLNRECSLFTNDGRYVIVGAASFIPEENRPNFYELYTNNEVIKPTAGCPLEDYTLYIIDLHFGRISHSKDFRVDKIILSHNQGVYLYNNTLAILSIHHQTIYIFSIAEGTFIEERAIGRFCSQDDQYLYNNTFASERSSAFREPTINSLKHRMLVFLFKVAKEREESGLDRLALRKFYRRFDDYKDMRMWKMQLLDDDHLFIKYAHEDVVTLKAHEPNSQHSLFVVYHIWRKQILGVYSNQCLTILAMYEQFCDSFRNSTQSNRTPFTCSPSNNIYSKLLHTRFKQTIIGARGGSEMEATKRILAQLPISAQSYSSSPYLDLGLFSYDDKWVSAMERPKACAEFPIRFYARDSGRLKFRIFAGAGQQANAQAGTRRLVAFIFHPTEPFAISVQRINTDYIANFHLRHVPCVEDPR
ncbi:DET1 homolog [Anopheles ziemanni]|uniref:DET1 homolog n=1 Tax=Anopheles coustani TaxID=139045 RepID=UPI0026597202|nr:DET1 homolog [Anopheles coustani]XP_058171918.1 DET1 homolog [Anopheles ziemanni]